MVAIRIGTKLVARRLWLVRGHVDYVDGLAFSPDGRHLASASADGTARIFDAATGKLERTLRGHGTITSVAFSPNGSRIVTSGADATIRIWGLNGSSPLILYGHLKAVNTAAFNPDGDRIVSAGEDGTVRVWDAVNGAALVVIQRYAVANGAEFSPRRDDRIVSEGTEGESNRSVVSISTCTVCGAFKDALRIARSRPSPSLTQAERQRLLAASP